MSLSDRRTFLLGALGALAACGFAPAYGPGSGGSRLMNAVTMQAPKRFPEYLLVQNLEERLGRPAAARYDLTYAIDLQTDGTAIAKDDVTLRYNQIAEVTYALRDTETKMVVASGKVSSFTSYSGTGSTVANAAAEKDATRRLMQILSDQIVTRLAAVAPGFAT